MVRVLSLPLFVVVEIDVTHDLSSLVALAAVGHACDLAALEKRLHRALKIGLAIVVPLPVGEVRKDLWRVVGGVIAFGERASVRAVVRVEQSEKNSRRGDENGSARICGTRTPFCQRSLIVSPMLAKFAFLRVRMRSSVSTGSPFFRPSAG